jgi:hypothetical protein
MSFGLLGAMLNALAAIAVIPGSIAQAIRDEERGTDLAPVLHLGYVAVNFVALVFLLTRLGDEDRPALPTIAIWCVGTAALWIAYWSWVV